jgi:hypothetical protein
MSPPTQYNFEAVAIHEAAHAVAMVAVGARIQRAYVLPPPRPGRNYGYPGRVTPATVPTLHQGVLIGLAGSLVEYHPITLSGLIREHYAGDIATVEDEVRKVLLAKAKAAGQQPPAELVNAFGRGYVRRRYEALQRWLLQEAAQSAMVEVAAALKDRALVHGSLTHDEVEPICDALGIRPVPSALRAGPNRTRTPEVPIRRWPW